MWTIAAVVAGYYSITYLEGHAKAFDKYIKELNNSISNNSKNI